MYTQHLNDKPFTCNVCEKRYNFVLLFFPSSPLNFFLFCYYFFFTDSLTNHIWNTIPERHTYVKSRLYVMSAKKLIPTNRDLYFINEWPIVIPINITSAHSVQKCSNIKGQSLNTLQFFIPMKNVFATNVVWVSSTKINLGFIVFKFILKMAGKIFLARIVIWNFD